MRENIQSKIENATETPVGIRWLWQGNARHGIWNDIRLYRAKCWPCASTRQTELSFYANSNEIPIWNRWFFKDRFARSLRALKLSFSFNLEKLGLRSLDYLGKLKRFSLPIMSTMRFFLSSENIYLKLPFNP